MASRNMFGSGKTLAAPSGWDEMEAAERRFAEAEEVRLMYVAVTRAKEELIVSRLAEKPAVSPWAMLNPWLDEHAELLDIELTEPEPRPELDEGWASEAGAQTEEARARLRDASRPGFLYRSVTDLAKRSVEVESRAAASEPGVPRQAFRGYSWGSAVHGALAFAAAEPTSEGLRSACRDLLVDFERPLDDHGEPTELAELLELVSVVLGSDLWRRARAAESMLVEAPFAVAMPGDRDADTPRDGSGEDSAAPKGKRQLDLFGGEVPAGGDGMEVVSSPSGASGPEEGPTRILEGVVDLAFREGGRWVIVDYKTDLGTDPTFADRERAYRRQVGLYADAWAALTGEAVKERVLFFTAQGRQESW